MGYISHHAVVLTSWDDVAIAAAHAKATELGMLVTPVTSEGVNGYRSFLVAPDGSKEGWEDSELGWRRRCQLIEWLRAGYLDDGSSHISWVEVQFGSDEPHSAVTRGSDRDEEGIPDVEEVY